MYAESFPVDSLEMCIKNPKMFISFNSKIVLVEIYQREKIGYTQKPDEQAFLLNHTIKKTQEENKYSTIGSWLNFRVHLCWNTMQTLKIQ